MEANGSQPNVSGLDEILSGLGALIEEKQAEVDELNERLGVQQAELRRLRAIERAALGPRSKPGPRSQAGTMSRTGEEELRIVADRLRNRPQDAFPDIPGSFTLRTLKRELGMSKSHAERALSGMRSREMIRLVGERKETQAPRPSRVFVLNDEQ